MHMRSYAQGHPRSWWESFGEGRLEIARLDPLARQLQHFVEVARGRAQPLVSLRDGYLNMVVVEAIVRAAETRREIRVSECLA
jgi:predicted dehydrogenase